MSIRDYTKEQLDQQRVIAEEDVQRVIRLNETKTTGYESEEEIRKRYPIGEKSVWVMTEEPSSGLFSYTLEVQRVLTSEFDEFDKNYEFSHLGYADVPRFRPKS